MLGPPRSVQPAAWAWPSEPGSSWQRPTLRAREMSPAGKVKRVKLYWYGAVLPGGLRTARISDVPHCQWVGVFPGL